MRRVRVENNRIPYPKPHRSIMMVFASEREGREYLADNMIMGKYRGDSSFGSVFEIYLDR